VCARTDAVLAVHLDGDLAHEAYDGHAFDREACEPLGYGFVSDDSLHTHLRECATCQTALQRARRLDAALASMAGRAVADQVAASGCSLEELSNQWLNCAAMVAGGEVSVDAGSPGADSGRDSAMAGSLHTGADGSEGRAGDEDLDCEDPDGEDLDWLFDRTMQQPVGHLPGKHNSPGKHNAAEAGTGSKRGTAIAIAGMLAACLATWLCISTIDAASEVELGNGQTIAQRLANENDSSPYESPFQRLQASFNSRFNSSYAGAASPAPSEPSTVAQTTNDAELGLAPRRAQQSLARSLHAARNRELPEQRTARPEDLSQRVRNRALSVAERLAAAHRLLRGTRAGSSAARYATDQLLLALAGCGDLDQDDIALHEQLLDEVRSSGPVLVRLEHRLVSLPSRNRDRSELSHNALATILVSTRIENARLDQAIRRALRRNDTIADVVASALRCGVRANGTTQLLLDCWHDQVAIGKQENTAKWAEFWFRGQAATSFAQLAHVHAGSHSAPERVRCLLAMGCVHDGSTLAPLLAELAAPRRVEACAAACGLATLPHRVLKQLLSQAKLEQSGLLRAALARAGMPQANRWIQALALSKPQLRLMRTGPVTRFSEVAAWFRNGLLTAD
jgi:hypothetical protein